MKNNTTNHTDIAIIGGGAAGMMAAIFAGRSAPEGTRITVFDGAKKLGAKVLIAGGGRCNVTHDIVNPIDYAGGTSRNTIKKVLKSFSVKETTAFFAALGVELKREATGKLFPATNKARTVLSALIDAMEQAGVEVLTDHRVLRVNWEGEAPAEPSAPEGTRLGGSLALPERTPRFLITTSQSEFTARRVILATGGKALPSSGSDGAGYAFAKSLGHSVTETWPALVALLLEDGHWLTTLSGLATPVELTLSTPSGKAIHRQDGPMLLTHFGLSGPAAMDISRHIQANATDRPALTVSFRPGENFEAVEKSILDFGKASPNASVFTAIRRDMPERMARALLEHGAGVDSATPMNALTREARRTIAHTLAALPLPVVGDRGYKYAEVTAGGVPMNEVVTATMASRLCDGLYLCGELLDVDGRIGGYNFQWAWCTGRLAGIAASAPPIG